MVTSDFRPEVEIRPFHACAMHPAIITGTVRSLLTWLWGRYHVPENAFLVFFQCLTKLITGGIGNTDVTSSIYNEITMMTKIVIHQETNADVNEIIFR